VSKIEKLFKPAEETWPKDESALDNGLYINHPMGYSILHEKRKYSWLVYTSILSGIMSILMVPSPLYGGWFNDNLCFTEIITFFLSCLSIITGVVGFSLVRKNPLLYKLKKVAKIGIILGAFTFILFSISVIIIILSWGPIH
jgi:hypothetical protein